MISQELEERQWGEQLRAIRHFPPDTSLPGPADSDSRQLLADLLRLPDDVAPLRWLMAERGQLAALLALREALRHLARRARGLERARAEGYPLPYDALHALVPVALLIALDDDPVPSADRLRETLRAFRVGRAPHQIPIPTPEDAELGLLGDLLRLSEERDPLHWLAMERGAHVARAALRSVLQDARPPAALSLGHLLARQRPRQKLRLGRGIHTVIDEIDFGQGGFAVTVHLRFPLERVPTGEGGWRLPFWPGFDRVTDDRGHHYLLQLADWEAGTQLRWWYRQRLRMVCYPAVAVGATTLTFSALPATLAYRLTDRLRGPLQLPDELLGEVTWCTRIPSGVASPAQ